MEPDDKEESPLGRAVLLACDLLLKEWSTPIIKFAIVAQFEDGAISYEWPTDGSNLVIAIDTGTEGGDGE